MAYKPWIEVRTTNHDSEYFFYDNFFNGTQPQRQQIYPIVNLVILNMINSFGKNDDEERQHYDVRQVETNRQTNK